MLSVQSSVADEPYVKLFEKLYVSKYELTNAEYNLFLSAIKAKNATDQLKICQPDSTLWSAQFSYSFNMPYQKNYHWHPSYSQFPLVNVSKEAIELYCSWITERYNSNGKRKFKRVIYRLPTAKEWALLSAPILGHRLPWLGYMPYELNKKGCIIPFANLKIFDYATNSYNYVWDKAYVAVEVGRYKPNALGLFDVIGNVSELTSDGLAKGGSWDNILEESMVDKTQAYSAPDPRVGYRLVMEIVEE
jgi:formylglycine-generating enzyme required for sulfatase activity